MKILKSIIDFILSWKVIGPFIYIMVGFLLYSIIISIINRLVSKRKRKTNHKKEDTVINLIKNVIKYLKS